MRTTTNGTLQNIAPAATQKSDVGRTRRRRRKPGTWTVD